MALVQVLPGNRGIPGLGPGPGIGGLGLQDGPLQGLPKKFPNNQYSNQIPK